MLLVAAHRLRQAGATVVCADHIPGHPVEAYRDADIQLLFPPSKPARRAKPLKAFFTLSRVAGRLLPMAPPGFVLRQAPNALVDISGYAFGDPWGHRRLSNFAHRARYYRRKGKPVVMLPQMLGPFDQPKVRQAFRRLSQATDLVCARDDRSFAYAADVMGASSPRLLQAPDITIFSECLTSTAAACAPRKPYVCIVPNQRVLDSGAQKDSWAPMYRDRLLTAAHMAHDAGFEVDVVVHDSTPGDDDVLARALVAELRFARLVIEPDPIALKKRIAQAHLLVGSRFHGIVGALSSGVPAVVMGWSHKYEMLLQDFGLPDWTYGPQEPATAFVAALQRGLDDDDNAAARALLRERKESLRASHDAMWQAATQALGLSRSAVSDDEAP